MDNTPFTTRRPVVKNIVRLLVWGCVLAAVLVLYELLEIDEPKNVPETVFQSVLFCVTTITMLFSFAYIADCIRNLVSPATVKVIDGKLTVVGFPPVALSDIESVLLTVPVKKEKEQPEKAYIKVITKKDDAGKPDDIIITQKMADIPIETVKYAIETRLSLNNQNEV